MEFKEVYELYFRDVYKFLLSLCHNEEFAEELTQDTFVKAMQNYDKFRGECKITVWLCQIAKNSFYLHSKQKKQIADVDLSTLQVEDIFSIEIHFSEKEQALQVHKLLHNLSEPYKEVFTLRVFLPCNIIEELLPLYCVEVCSEESRLMIEGHLSECEHCSKILSDLQLGNTITKEDRIKNEDERAVRKKIAHSWKKSLFKSFAKGITVAAVIFGVTLGT